MEDWEASVAEFLADRKAGVDELKTVTPQILEEQYTVLLLKKQVVDTLVERVEIDQERNLHVQIRLNLLDILGKDTRNRTTAGVQNSEVETYTCMPDMYPAGRSLSVYDSKTCIWAKKTWDQTRQVVISSLAYSGKGGLLF